MNNFCYLMLNKKVQRPHFVRAVREELTLRLNSVEIFEAYSVCALVDVYGHEDEAYGKEQGVP
jgi:hypothetical protein